MKQYGNFKLGVLLLASAGLASCSSDDTFSGSKGQSGEPVKTQFAISVPAGKAGRLAQNIVQGQNPAVFRGMNNINLISFNAAPAAGGTGTEVIKLGSILDNELQANTSAKVYYEVPIAVGTTNFLFYGEAYSATPNAKTDGALEARTVILATGASHRKLGLSQEDALTGCGISYCAVCDGAFYDGADVAVVGGGDTALQDALFLANTCRSVTLIHRRDAFRASAQLVRRAQAQENIRILRSCTVQKLLLSDDSLQGAELFNGKTGETERIYVEGLFIAVGQTPQSAPFEDAVATENGYYLAGEDTKTSLPGIFAAGDGRKKQVRQLTTAVSDGAAAALAACRWLDARQSISG